MYCIVLAFIVHQSIGIWCSESGGHSMYLILLAYMVHHSTGTRCMLFQWHPNVPHSLSIQCTSFYWLLMYFSVMDTVLSFYRHTMHLILLAFSVLDTGSSFYWHAMYLILLAFSVLTVKCIESTSLYRDLCTPFLGIMYTSFHWCTLHRIFLVSHVCPPTSFCLISIGIMLCTWIYW